MTDDRLKELTTFMRENGVRRLEIEDGEFSAIEMFHYPPPVSPPEAFAPEVTDRDDVCNCGHDADSHMGGLCIEGCFEETCRKRRE